MDKETAKQKVKQLVDKYESEKLAGKTSQYTEADTKTGFIEPLFQALGWDTQNRNEVSLEGSVSGGRVDYSFKVADVVKYFLEAKAIRVDLHKEEYAEQTLNYAWHKGVVWTILTDFELIKVFNAEVKAKRISESIFFEIPYNEYITKFEQLWLLSKESIINGLLNKEAEKWGKKLKKQPVSKQILDDLLLAREKLTKNINSHSRLNNITEQELDEAVQRILDRLIFIRTCEDRNIEQNHLITATRNPRGKGLWEELKDIFRKFDESYNSKLFEKHLCEQLTIDEEIVQEVIELLYHTKDETIHYDFSMINADVLGNIYEQYLGHILKKTSHTAKLKETHQHRKEQGIYYTPTYIVDYIVKNTVGEVLKNLKPKNATKLKMLDPACGSGSFVIRAFDEMVNYWQKQSPNEFSYLRKIEILKNNIYGVDLDKQAVEITQMNLLLKTLQHKERLPVLKNIKCGNSLIDDPAIAGEKAFKWEDEFKEVVSAGGFDVIIGNPPYFNVDTLGVKSPEMLYLMNFYNQVWQDKSDILFYFIYKGITLLKQNGILAFIVSRSFLEALKAQRLRQYIMTHCKIMEIIDFGHYSVFEDAGIATSIIILQKVNKIKSNNIRYLKIVESNSKISDLTKIDEKIVSKEEFTYSQDNLNEISWNFINPNYKTIIDKIDLNSSPLRELCCVGSGMQTAANDVFVFDKEKIIKYKIDMQWFKKRMQNSLVKRYCLLKSEDYLLYVENVDSYDNLPKNIRDYLKENENVLKDRAAYKRGDMDWWKYSFPMHKELYKNPKLMTSYRNSGNSFAFDEKGEYLGLTDTTVVFLKDRQYSIEYGLALLNSKLLDFRYKKMAKLTGKSTYEYFENVISRIPIYKINFSDKNERQTHDDLVGYADKMVELNRKLQEFGDKITDERKRIEAEIKKTDEEIDQLVYKLYGLTEEEIRIIEGQ